MARCEDWPCCRHEAGCCPDFDEETGEQLNMVCTCGAKIPVNSRYSICSSCLSISTENEEWPEDCYPEGYTFGANYQDEGLYGGTGYYDEGE